METSLFRLNDDLKGLWMNADAGLGSGQEELLPPLGNLWLKQIGVEMETANWIDLTDEDRNRAFEALPDMLEGFMKKWGWLHFAKAIEEICREKNAVGRNEFQVLAICTAYEQGVGKGRESYCNPDKTFVNPYSSEWSCSEAWQRGYDEGRKQQEGREPVNGWHRAYNITDAARVGRLLAKAKAANPLDGQAIMARDLVTLCESFLGLQNQAAAGE